MLTDPEGVSKLPQIDCEGAVTGGTKAKAAFLDRDGVINVDHGYVHDPSNFELCPGVLGACRALHEAGYKLIVVTNQAGIGRGYYTPAQFHDFTRWVEGTFRDAGAPITATYHCPHHPEKGLGQYRQACECRKPAPGMLLRAIHEHELDAAGSFLVGDKPSDVEAARAAGVHGYLLGGVANYGSLAELVGALLPPRAERNKGNLCVEETGSAAREPGQGRVGLPQPLGASDVDQSSLFVSDLRQLNS